MRTRGSLAAITVAATVAVGVAHADSGPGAVYNDFAQDGVLSCSHSRADLVAALRSGSLNQYGDPLTLARLKLAIRKQLAGGCRRQPGSRQSATGSAGAPGGGKTSSGGQTRRSAGSATRHSRSRASNSTSPRQASRKRVASTSGSNASFIAGRGLIIGLLVAALALGGWLTKHALAARD
jgi:cobalamin biosynthesis Mg chelatase CobN